MNVTSVPPRTRRRRTFAAAVTVLVLTAGIAVQATAASAAPPGGLHWGDCPGGAGTVGLECAAIQVPVDWGAPGGPALSLLLGRLPAYEPTEAEGTVLVNYGGPGGPAVGLMRSDPAPFAGLREHMDVVTWDLRGYTSATGAGPLCRQTQQPLPDVPADQADFDALAEHNRQVGAECRAADPLLFDNMDSGSHARDLEAVRQALGDEPLNYLSASYGGIIGQTYASLFPERIRTMVLDGTWDHSTDPVTLSVDQARDTERQLRRFFDWCRADATCALHDADVPEHWRKLVARAGRNPIPAPAVGAVYDDIELQTLGIRFAAAGRFAELGEALASGLEGDASGFAFDPARPYPAAPSPGMTECLDFARPADYTALHTQMRKLARVAPNTGAASTPLLQALSCVGWPTEVANPPTPWTADLPPMLGVGTWLEYYSTARVVSRAEGSGTIFHDGPGHSLYLAMKDSCTINHVDAYLTTTKLPPAPTTC